MSTLRVNSISDIAGTGSPNITQQCKAWVNFNGTGTVAIRAQYNVASITDDGTGQYTVNFTTAMPDANYSFIAQAGNGGALNTAGTSYSGGAPTTTTARLIVDNGGGTLQDRDYVMAAIFR